MSAHVDLPGDPAPTHLTLASTVAEVIADPVAGPELGALVTAMFGDADRAPSGSGVDMVRMIGSTPVGRFVGSLGQHMTRERLTGLLDAANAANRYPG